jgi:crotonobetainyl-CoA:carnitine CoA-transferase CaiB-like acyl-CoA transferase
VNYLQIWSDRGAAVVQVPAGGDAISPADPARVWSGRRKRPLGTGTGAGQRITEVRRLLSAADLFISDLPPGRLEGSGLDAMSVREGDRGIVHLWMPPYGWPGAG